VTINGAVISYGPFLNALFAFVLVSAAVYFSMVAPMNALKPGLRAMPRPLIPPARSVRNA